MRLLRHPDLLYYRERKLEIKRSGFLATTVGIILSLRGIQRHMSIYELSIYKDLYASGWRSNLMDTISNLNKHHKYNGVRSWYVTFWISQLFSIVIWRRIGCGQTMLKIWDTFYEISRPDPKRWTTSQNTPMIYL